MIVTRIGIARIVRAACAGVALAALAAGTASAQTKRMGRNELTVGTGLLGYFSGDAPGTSAAWEARYGFNVIPLITIEGGYLGAAGGASGPGATIATIVEGDVRINPFAGGAFNPYVLAGAGWGAFTGTSTRDDNSTFQLPLGAGADIRLTDRFDLGGRFVYRIAAGDDIGAQRAAADNWSATVRAGANF